MKVGNSSISAQLDLIKNLKSIDSVTSNKNESSNGTASGASAVSFGEMLMQKFEETNAHGIEAEKAIQRSLTGEDQNPHDAVIAIQKASLSLTLMLGIKERLEKAYQDIIRTPI